MVEAEVEEAGMDGEVREPSVEVIEAPVEDPRMGDEVTADEAGAVEGRAEPAVETRSRRGAAHRQSLRLGNPVLASRRVGGGRARGQHTSSPSCAPSFLFDT